MYIMNIRSSRTGQTMMIKMRKTGEVKSRWLKQTQQHRVRVRFACQYDAYEVMKIVSFTVFLMVSGSACALCNHRAIYISKAIVQVQLKLN